MIGVAHFYKNFNKFIQFKRYGIQYESVAKDVFEAITNLKVMPCGIFVDQYLNFLAGSPDGIIRDDGIIEIKCPSRIKNTTPQEAAKMKMIKYLTINKKGEIKLKRTFQYYYQVQGQLHITQRQYCFFIVWTPNGSHIYIIFMYIYIFKNYYRIYRIFILVLYYNL